MFLDQNAVAWGSFAASLATVLAASFVGAQAYIARKDFQSRNKRASVEKTSELMRFYIEAILPYTGYIGTIAERTGVRAIRDALDSKDLVEFTESEMKSIMTADQIKTYSLLFSGEIPRIDLHHARYALRHVGATQNFKQQMLSMIPGIVPQKVGVYEINAEFIHIASSIMSNLEYFCMCFNEGIADDKLAYSSIHQTFIPLVKTFYVRIAQYNTDPDKQYYSQIQKNVCQVG